MEPVYKKKYQISISNVNINKRLGLLGTLGYLQDIATEHAEVAGFGLEKMMATQSFWVLVRQKLRMDHFPKWNDTIEVHTWSRAPEGMYAFREFEIFHNGEKIGDCSTVWMILDGRTRRVKKPDFDISEINPRRDYEIGHVAQKVERSEQATELEKINTIKVRISDLDLNMHVNNTKYSQWILDSIELERHRKASLKEFEINFTGETHLGDEIDIYSARDEDSHLAHDVFYQGIRQSDQKMVFVARILADEK